MGLPQFQPMVLARTREAFDHADFVFELKYDGFRALAYIDAGACRLVSRKGHVYKAYAPLCEWIGKHLRAEDAVLDGELACLDGEGKPPETERASSRNRRRVPRAVCFESPAAWR